MKVLAIGNSFSQDATRYLHQIAKADGVELKVVNLCIGGCSLRTHYLNMLEDSARYGFEFNGENTGLLVSIKMALMSDEWDYITLQQVSHQSPNYETYQPYLTALAEYVRKYCPQAKLLLHQTWAYEEDSARLARFGYTKQKKMFDNLEKAYNKAAKSISADGIILSGLAFQKALKSGIDKLHRDSFHASLGFGRYLLGLAWYTRLTGNSVKDNTFSDFDEPVEAEKIAIAKAVADSLYQ